jgi:tellurite resistance protein TerC
MASATLSVPLWAWVGFIAFVIAMLALDLLVISRGVRAMTLRASAAWSAVWIGLAGAFAVLLGATMGGEPALQFVTGYIVEWSLSVDNLFVFLVIFTYFRVPPEARRRVLFYGILGAIVMRGAFIAGGIALLNQFHWIIYVFGAFLVVTGVKLAFQSDEHIEPEKNPVLVLARRWLPVSRAYEGTAFFVRTPTGVVVTPLFLVLLVIESTDIVFAVDSVPAILAITREPFIVYTSNLFAILGLRALFFLIAGVLEYFRYLRYGLSAVLVFVGVKMLVADVYKIHPAVSLAIIGTLLAVSMIASVVVVRQEARAARREAEASGTPPS